MYIEPLTVDFFQHCEHDPTVLLAVSKLFWSERKIQVESIDLSINLYHFFLAFLLVTQSRI